MALARAAPLLLLLLAALSAGPASGQLRSVQEDQQLRQLVREAVSDALRTQLAEFRCGGGNIRKRQAPVRAEGGGAAAGGLPCLELRVAGLQLAACRVQS